MPPVVLQASVSNFEAAYNLEIGSIDVAWISVTEMSVKRFIIQIKESQEIAFSDVTFVDPLGAGAQYISQQFLPEGIYTFQLKAEFLDGTTVIVGQPTNAVSNFTLKATIKNFGAIYNSATGAIDVSWRSIEEVGLISYTVQYKGSQDIDFIDIAPSLDRVGIDFDYLFPTFLPDESYTFRLIANFQDGTSVIVGQSTTPVVTPGT